MKTYKGHPVIFAGPITKLGSENYFNFTHDALVEGYEGAVKLPVESVQMLNWNMPGILAVNYEAGGTDFWTACYPEDIKEAREMKGPYVTEQQVADKIGDVLYHLFEGTNTTVCLIVLLNGFTVVGKSACVSNENFDSDTGRKLAFEDAERQISQFEGYMLCENRLANK